MHILSVCWQPNLFGSSLETQNSNRSSNQPISDKQSDTIHRTFVDHCDWSRKEIRYSIGFSFEVWRPLEKAKKCRVLGLITPRKTLWFLLAMETQNSNRSSNQPISDQPSTSAIRVPTDSSPSVNFHYETQDDETM